jgi:hypothetical protein
MKTWNWKAVCGLAIIGFSVVALGETPPTVAGDDHAGTTYQRAIPPQGTYAVPQSNPAEDKNAKLAQYINACMPQQGALNGGNSSTPIADTFRRLMQQ